MGYILSEEEYYALDKAFTKAKLYDDGQMLIQVDNADYYCCYEEEYIEGFACSEMSDEEGDTFYIVPILDYMSEIDDALCDFISCYGFTKTDIEAYDGLCKKAGCFTSTCGGR